MKGRSRAKAAMRRRSSWSSSSSSYYSYSEEEVVIRKGPWKADEDEALRKHVHKYGPRDWSSLLSKGILHRTGKSCRLRWVNKLRPNLKNGCKFSAEEERVVIELQAQLGNKWAKISTYLPGRTDNDVKNFWSSRRKRLARLLVNNSQPQITKSKVPKDKAESTSSMLEMVPLNEPANSYDTLKNPFPAEQQQPSLCFPKPPSDLQLLCPSAHEELIRGLDLDLLSAFPPVASGAIVDPHSLEMVDYLGPLQPTGFGDQQLSAEIKVEAGTDLVLDDNPSSPDRFFDDLPADIFDQMEQLLPSPPSDW